MNVAKPIMEQNHENEGDNNASKRQKVSKDDVAAVDQTNNNDQGEVEDDCCVLCMEPSSSDKALLPVHQCPQCSPTAWKICVCCNERLLSRTCPVCRSDYAPLVLYSMPGLLSILFLFHSLGLPLTKLADANLDPEEKSKLYYKFGIVRHMIGKSNVGVWNASENKMYLSLPQEFVECTKEFSSLTVAIEVQADRILNNSFNFDNKVWDEIEKEVEHGIDLQMGELRPSSEAIQWVLSHTKHPSAQIFTMLTPQDWQYMLDPRESNDTVEALKAIKNFLVLGNGNVEATNGTDSDAGCKK